MAPTLAGPGLLMVTLTNLLLSSRVEQTKIIHKDTPPMLSIPLESVKICQSFSLEDLQRSWLGRTGADLQGSLHVFQQFLFRF